MSISVLLLISETTKEQMDMSREEIVAWLKLNKEGLDLSHFAREVKVHKSLISRVISGKKINKFGTIARLPDHCLPMCRKVIGRYQVNKE